MKVDWDIPDFVILLLNASVWTVLEEATNGIVAVLSLLFILLRNKDIIKKEIQKLRNGNSESITKSNDNSGR